MMNNDQTIYRGIIGTAIGTAGAGLSVTEVQAIIAIICTVLGFIISVLIPCIIKIYNAIKKAKIGTLDEPTMSDLIDDLKTTGSELKKLGSEVSENKSEGEEK